MFETGPGKNLNAGNRFGAIAPAPTIAKPAATRNKTPNRGFPVVIAGNGDISIGAMARSHSL